MKTFITASLFTVISVATAQLSDIPSCALNCFIAPLSSDGCPSLEDFNCHCKKSDSLFAAVTPCVQKACSAADLATVITVVQKTCAAAGVSVAVSVPGAAASTPVALSAAPYSTVATPVSSSAKVTSAATPMSSVMSSVVVAPSVSLSKTQSSTANGTVSTRVPSPSVSLFPGAAPRATQAVGLLGAAAVALFAL